MDNRLNIYVAGPITGQRDTVPQRFMQGDTEVRALGYNPVNPIEVNGWQDLGDGDLPENWRLYLRRDIHTLAECDGIYLLRGWENSRGARLEKLIADGLDLIILYQEEG